MEPSAGVDAVRLGFVLSTRRSATGAEVARVAGVVGHRDAQVVEAVGDAGRVPGGGDRRPGAGAGRRALEGDRGDAGAGVGGVRAQRDRAAQVGAGVVHRRAGRGVVDDAVLDDRGRARVARVVGDDDPEVVDAVGEPGRVPVDGVRVGRVGAERRPRVGVRGRDLEVDALDAGARVARRGRQRDRAAEELAGVGEAAAGGRRVDRPRVGGRARRRRCRRRRWRAPGRCGCRRPGRCSRAGSCRRPRRRRRGGTRRSSRPRSRRTRSSGPGSRSGRSGPASIVVCGATVSTVHANAAGVGSTLPAASVARTWKVWLPSARPV